MTSLPNTLEDRPRILSLGRMFLVVLAAELGATVSFLLSFRLKQTLRMLPWDDLFHSQAAATTLNWSGTALNVGVLLTLPWLEGVRPRLLARLTGVFAGLITLQALTILACPGYLNGPPRNRSVSRPEQDWF